VYGTSHECTIQAVSSALGDYLVQEYRANAQAMTIAQHDLPDQLPAPTLSAWRTQIRTQLGIASDTHVYCYNGSAKPWQCPEKVVEFFKSFDKLRMSGDYFLLVLTQDTAIFNQLLTQAGIDSRTYAVMNVPHAQIYQYLAAADTGIMFRAPHIINWISRPTKILEYHAARLDIVHNNTIAWLTEQPEIKQQIIEPHMPAQNQKTAD
jgi:hypothetical protein